MSGVAKRQPVTFDLGRVMGAVVSGESLSLVSIGWDEDEQLPVLQNAAWFTLHGRSQDAIEQLHDELIDYACQDEFDAILIRGAPGGGAYSAKCSTYKVETLLQLLPGISVGIVPSNTVIAWRKRVDPTLPPPSLGLRSAQRKIQERAIEVAMFARERLSHFEE